MFYPFNSQFYEAFDRCNYETPCYIPIYIAYGLLAISSSMMVVFWSCVPLVVSEIQMGTAYGIMLSLESLIGIVFN